MTAGIARCEVAISRSDLLSMCRFVREIDALSRSPAYSRHLEAAGLPDVAYFDPGYHSVMMGYDFHIGDEGPKLIEINNNAGGVFLALQAQYAAVDIVNDAIFHRARRKLVRMFADEYRAYAHDPQARPKLVAIIDENPEEQFNHTEMQVFASVLTAEWQVPAIVVDPSGLTSDDNRLFYQDRMIDMVYNRHCDFYLETPEMQAIKAAYLQHKVCLSPNPWIYGRMGDKRRMMLWSDRELMSSLGVTPGAVDFIVGIVPQSRLLAAVDPDEIWAQRKQWVFKPTTQYGSRGVLLGTSIRANRFKQLVPEQTIIQRYIRPTRTQCAGAAKSLKTDVRLFAYKDRVLGVAARVYDGQVTNFRAPGSGYARVAIK